MVTVKGLTKKTFVFLAIVCVLVAIAITYYKHQAYKIIPIITHLDYIEYNSAEELSKADLILTGTPTEDFLSRKHVNTHFPDGKLQDFFSIAEINIEKVIKSPTDFSIQKNTIFPIIEPNGLIKDVDGKMKKLIKENYVEMEKGKKYLLFLKKNERGEYFLINLNGGKFNLDGKDTTENVLLNSAERTKKAQLQKEVLAMYEKVLNP